MCHTEFQIYILLTMVFTVSGQECHSNWFGPGCKYKCHCSGSTSCEADGSCSNYGLCEVPYFGPSCQYVDLVAESVVHGNVLNYLSDSNDRTCNEIIDENITEVSIWRGVPFSWFRIVVNNEQYISKFVTHINGEVCMKERKFIVSQNVVDVTCDNLADLTTLQITGQIVPYVCSIYISKGRNLSLKEKTIQSTNLNNDEYSFGPQKAVDGNREQFWGSFSCSQTKDQFSQPWWTVIFNSCMLLNLKVCVLLNVVEIYSRHEVAHRLTNFVFAMYERQGKLKGILSGGVGKQTMYLNIPPVGVIQYFSIRQAQGFRLMDSMLTLCEVEAYGEYKCPYNRYGLFCEGTCNCTNYEVCNAVSGMCGTACPAGYYGSHCDYQCSPNCLYVSCEYYTGKCSPCTPGYLEDTCNTACPPYTFGADCLLMCSTGCINNMCNNTNGICSCKNSYSGSMCLECRPGAFGSECQYNCSEGCSETCNNITGHCACTENYTGVTCTECQPGFFGKLCMFKCSDGCNGTCNNNTGYCSCKSNFVRLLCTECRPGYFGNSCMFECSVGCKDTCNNITGYCSCKSNFTGLTCTDCRPGTYGSKCNVTCSVGCTNTSACNIVTGSCVCKKDYIGFKCAACRPGTFGTGCRFKCSVGCDDICNEVTGHCSCKTDYTGLTCSDLICPEGYNCTERCHCKEHEVCEFISGTCTGQCIPGYFTVNCTSMCSEGCNYKGCDQINGKCIQCSPGYMGDFCDKECLSGTFGLQCDHNCSKYCAEVCNIATGQCSCKAGYTGAECSECHEGKYGVNCSLLCSELCYRNICRADTGECVSCIGQRIGRMCKDCSDKYYGRLCENRCSETCVNGTCDNVTGHCFACYAIHSGLSCSEKEDVSIQVSKQYLDIEYIIIMVLLVMCSVSIVMCCLPRRTVENINDPQTITNKDSAIVASKVGEGVTYMKS